MKFKYRFKGRVNDQLVLRGMLFKVGSKIDFCVSETELDFVKKHCLVEEIIDLEPKVVPTPEPVLEEKTDTQQKEVVNNDKVQPKVSRPNKNNNTRKV